MKTLRVFLAMLMALVTFTSTAFSAVVPADFVIDTADIGTIAGAMLTALGVIWIAKRVIGFMGR